MELAASDDELRAALFRFVDVVPACRSLDDLARHLAHYLERVEDPPPPLEVAMRMSGSRPGRAALGAAAAAGVRHMAHRFIIGDSPRDALDHLRSRWRRGIASTLDLLGEATVTEAEAGVYARRCHEALEVVASAARRWPDRPRLEHDAAGPLPRANVCVKVSALTPLLRADAPELGKRDAAGRLRPRSARRAGAALSSAATAPDRSRGSPPPRGAGGGAPPHRRRVARHPRRGPRARPRAARRGRVRLRALGGARRPGLPARLRRAPRPHPRDASRDRPRGPADHPARQGRLLGSRDRRGTGGCRRCSRSRPSPTGTSKR